jgi:hypothetical protein
VADGDRGSAVAAACFYHTLAGPRMRHGGFPRPQIVTVQCASWRAGQRMIPKSGYRFSEKIMLKNAN